MAGLVCPRSHLLCPGCLTQTGPALGIGDVGFVSVRREHHGALSTCSSPRQSCVQDTQHNVEPVFMHWKPKERSQEAYLYPLPKQGKKMYKILVLTYMKNLEIAIITVLCTI